LSLKVLCAALLFFGLPGGSARGADEFKIYLKTSPPLDLLRPFADPVTIALLVTHADGRPVETAHVSIVLDAPNPTAFLSTDFPLVEGSRLLQMSLPLRQGRAQWKYLFPIRGEYRLAVDLVTADGRNQSKRFVIPVAENRLKWIWLGLLCAGLFFLGLAAGRIFTTVSATLALLCFLCDLGWVANVIGHDSDSSVAKTERSSTMLEIATATVGKPTRLRWRAPDGVATLTRLSLAITHLEKHKLVFALEKVAVGNAYQVEFQFPDGAEYRVEAVAEGPGRIIDRSEQLVMVTGIEPPLAAQVPALLLFLAVIAFGLAAGRLSKTRGPR